MGDGLVVRKLVYGVDSFEAHSNEFAEIKAFKLSHLTNQINGSPYGVMKSWNALETINYGNVLLYNCLEALSKENPTYLDYDSILTK